MEKFIKAIFFIALLAIAGFMIWKVTSWKKIKTDDDLKKEYSYVCKAILKIDNAVGQNLSEMGTVPQVSTIYDLKKYVERYDKFCPIKDMWGNELLYKAISDTDYLIASAGSDGVFNGFEQEGQYSEYNGQDIIIETGAWKFAPKDAEY